MSSKAIIRRVSGIMQTLCILGLLGILGAAIALVCITFWPAMWAAESSRFSISFHVHEDIDAQLFLNLNDRIRIGMFLSVLPLYVSWIVTLEHLRRLFGEFRCGSYFSLSAMRHLRNAAFFYLLTLVLTPASDALRDAVFWSTGDFWRVTLSIELLTPIFIGLFIFVIAWLMDEARRLYAENQQSLG